MSAKTPTVTVSATSPSAALGTAITFTATVTGSSGAVAPSGAGTWTIVGVSGISSCDTTSGPSQTANASTYSCSVVASIAGTYSATFAYPGDSSYNPVAPTTSTSSTIISPATPTVSLTATGSSMLGGTALIVATVVGSGNAVGPTGTLIWTISGSAGITSCASNSGPSIAGNTATYTCSFQTPNVGTYTAVTNYSGDSNYLTVSSTPLTLTVTKQTPGVGVVASANPVLGGTTTLTTTVSGLSFSIAPMGNVSWLIVDPSGSTIPCSNPSTPTVAGNVVTSTCSFVTLLPGAYHINSTVASDANYLAATSTTIVVNLGVVNPTIFVTAIPSQATVGQTLTFAALVNGVTGLPAPTGVLTWTVSGQATSCTTTTNPPGGVNTAAYNCIVATPVSGNYTVTATYNGDTNYAALPVTAPVTVSVTPATPTISVTTTPVSPTLGSVITYTATVTGAVGAVKPTGAMTWLVAGQKTACDTSSGPQPGTLSTQNIYTCVLNATTVGSYTVTATYPGDSNYTSLPTTGPVTITIAQVAPAAVLTGIGDGILGGNIIFTASVTGPIGALAPTGSVVWTLSGTAGVTSCTSTPAAVSTGTTTTYVCNVAEVSYGTYTATAKYMGNSNYLISTSNAVTLGVSNLIPTITISISASASPTLGGVTTLTAIVSGPPGMSIPATPTTTYSCPSGTLDSSNMCDIADSSVPATPTTTYSCDSGTPDGSNMCDDTDPPTPATPTTTYSCDFGTPDSSNICDTPSSTIPATPTTTYSCTTGTLNGTDCVTPPDPTPAGSMSWSVINSQGAVVACSTINPTVDTSSQLATTAYSCSFPTTTAGTYLAQANFPGDTNYNAGNSPLINVVVPQASPTVTIIGTPLTNIFGAPVTFTATLTGVNGSVAPTGALTWNLGGPSPTCSSASGPSANGVIATYTCVDPVTTAGTYTASVNFAGDSNYLPLTQAGLTSIVVGPELPTISFVNTPAAPTLGQIITFIATVNSNPGGPAPGGVITWTISGTSGATTCDTTSTPIIGVGSYVQSCSLIARTAGTYIAKAAYSGDNNYLALEQSSDPVTISKALPTVSVLNTGSPVAGGVVTFTAVVTGVPAAEAPTGTFAWTVTGTGDISTCVPTTTTFTVANAVVFACDEQLPTVGTYDATGVYSSDNNYMSNSATTPDVVTITSTAPQFLPLTLGAITNLKAKQGAGNLRDEVTLTWDPLTSADTYIVEAGSNLSALNPVTCDDDTENTCVVAGLVSGNTYYFWVNGYGLGGQGTPATTSIALPVFSTPTQPGLPSFPTGGLPAIAVPFPLAAPALTAVGGDKSVALKWSSLPDTLRTGYRIDYSVDGRTWSKGPTLAANVTSVLVSNMTNGVSTVFRLTPFGDAGDGVASTVSATPGAPAQAPTSLTAQSGDGQVNLSWIAPTDTGGMQINSYLIEESLDGTNWIVASSVDGGTHNVNIQSLKNYTNYTFRVSAITNFGKGLSAVLATNAAALPSAPPALHIISSASQTVVIGWSLPTDSTGSSITGFKIEKSIDGKSWTASSSTSASALNATLSGLINGTTYEIRVTPIAGTGVGASSVILATPGAVPGTITGLSATAGDKKVTLSFTAPADSGGFNIDNYTVDMATSSGGPWATVIASSGSSITHIDVTSLKDGTTYFFRVSAVNQIGTGPSSRAVSSTPQSVAAAPVVQSFVMATSSATIAWVPPAGPTSKLIKQYLVETSPDGTLWQPLRLCHQQQGLTHSLAQKLHYSSGYAQSPLLDLEYQLLEFAFLELQQRQLQLSQVLVRQLQRSQLRVHLLALNQLLNLKINHS